MRAILVIISALGIAFLLITLLKIWQVRSAISTGQPTENIKYNYTLGAIFAFLIFAAGVWWLEGNSVPPNLTYSPAKIVNGTVIGGEFD